MRSRGWTADQADDFISEYGADAAIRYLRTGVHPDDPPFDDTPGGKDEDQDGPAPQPAAVD